MMYRGSAGIQARRTKGAKEILVFATSLALPTSSSAAQVTRRMKEAEETADFHLVGSESRHFGECEL